MSVVPGVAKTLLLDFVRSLGEDDCYMALLREGASFSPDTAVFTGEGEVQARGYVAGGKKMSGFACGLDEGIAWATWSNVEWMNASIKAIGAVIYARGRGNRVVSVFELDEPVKSSSQGLFRVKMPAPGAKDAVFWLA